MKQFLFLSIFIFFCSSLFSQDIVGKWKGNIYMNGKQIPIVFHFTTSGFKNNAQIVNAEWDSPSQNAMNLPFSGVIITDDSVHLEIKMISGSYEGKFVGSDSINGMWHQDGGQIALNFSRSNENIEVKKEIPLQLGEKEISIYSAGDSKLYGTLLSKNNQQKLAIIIAGSGPTDREGNNTQGDKANSYKMLAYSLDSQNIATFRYDKRGIAKSVYEGMKESDLVFDDYVKDAEKIFDYLHDTLGFKDIYFIGHSEGSLIGMLASQKTKVKGYISVAGAGRTIDELIEGQVSNQPIPDSIKNEITSIFNELKIGKEVNHIPQSLYSLFRKPIQPYLISWLKYSPANEIKKLKCPILILQGSCDIQVEEEDANNLHNANKKSTLDIIPFMSHTLKNAGKDCVDENKTYKDGSLPIDQLLVEDIVKFIHK